MYNFAPHIVELVEKTPPFSTKHAEEFFSHVSREVQDRCAPGKPPITDAEYGEMRLNSYERKYMLPYLSNKAFYGHVRLCASHVGAPDPGLYGLPRHYDHFILTDGVQELLRRFKILADKQAYTLRDAGGEDVEFMCPACSSLHQIDVSVMGYQFNENYTEPSFVGYMSHRTDAGFCVFSILSGSITFRSDSYHEHAGKTLKLPALEE